VSLSGRDFYLGKFGSEASKQAYDRAISEWLANGRALAAGADLSITELVRDYMVYAERYYRKDDRPTSEVGYLKASFAPLLALYGGTRACDFSPLALRACRDKIIASKVCRNTVNGRVWRITRMFRWAVEHEKVPASVHHGLKAVSGLRRGRSEARESTPVRPVPEAFVDDVLERVSPPVAAILSLMRVTGMRPGEACSVRACDIDMGGKVWCYRPGSHKTEHHEKTREIYLGPQAQAIIRSWLVPDVTAYLFSPRRFMEGHWLSLRRPGGRKAKPGATPAREYRERYDPHAVQAAVAKVCAEFDIPHWHPHQLRHNAATRLRREHGVDMARIILGHSDLKTTEIYAEADRMAAIKIMEQCG
jgi:integrase